MQAETQKFNDLADTGPGRLWLYILVLPAFAVALFWVCELAEPSCGSECSFPCRILNQTIDDPAGLFTAVLVWVVIVQVMFMQIQATWLRRSWKATAFANTVALDTARKELRAYVALYDIAFMREQIPLPLGQLLHSSTDRIGIRIQNYGQTPSFDTSILCNGSVSKPASFEVGNTPGVGKQMLHPGMSYSTEVSTSATPRFLESGWIWGHIVYRDIYRQWWRTNFFYAYHRPASAESNGLFTPETERNDEQGPYTTEQCALEGKEPSSIGVGPRRPVEEG